MDLANQNTFSVYKLTVLFLPPFVGTLLYILAHYFHVQINGDSATRKSSPQGNIKCLILRTSQKWNSLLNETQNNFDDLQIDSYLWTFKLVL